MDGKVKFNVSFSWQVVPNWQVSLEGDSATQRAKQVQWRFRRPEQLNYLDVFQHKILFCISLSESPVSNAFLRKLYSLKTAAWFHPDVNFPMQPAGGPLSLQSSYSSVWISSAHHFTPSCVPAPSPIFTTCFIYSLQSPFSVIGFIL